MSRSQTQSSSMLRCPECGHAVELVMPTDAYLFFYQCEARRVKVDTEASPQASLRYRIRSIPTMVLFKNGEE